MFQKLVVNIVEKLDSLIENKKSIIELDIEDLKEKIQETLFTIDFDQDTINDKDFTQLEELNITNKQALGLFFLTYTTTLREELFYGCLWVSGIADALMDNEYENDKFFIENYFIDDAKPNTYLNEAIQEAIIRFNLRNGYDEEAPSDTVLLHMGILNRFDKLNLWLTSTSKQSTVKELTNRASENFSSTFNNGWKVLQRYSQSLLNKQETLKFLKQNVWFKDLNLEELLTAAKANLSSLLINKDDIESNFFLSTVKFENEKLMFTLNGDDFYSLNLVNSDSEYNIFVDNELKTKLFKDKTTNTYTMENSISIEEPQKASINIEIKDKSNNTVFIEEFVLFDFNHDILIFDQDGNFYDDKNDLLDSSKNYSILIDSDFETNIKEENVSEYFDGYVQLITNISKDSNLLVSDGEEYSFSLNFDKHIKIPSWINLLELYAQKEFLVFEEEIEYKLQYNKLTISTRKTDELIDIDEVAKIIRWTNCNGIVYDYDNETFTSKLELSADMLLNRMNTIIIEFEGQTYTKKFNATIIEQTEKPQYRTFLKDKNDDITQLTQSRQLSSYDVENSQFTLLCFHENVLVNPQENQRILRDKSIIHRNFEFNKFFTIKNYPYYGEEISSALKTYDDIRWNKICSIRKEGIIKEYNEDKAIVSLDTNDLYSKLILITLNNNYEINSSVVEIQNEQIKVPTGILGFCLLDDSTYVGSHFLTTNIDIQTVFTNIELLKFLRFSYFPFGDFFNEADYVEKRALREKARNDKKKVKKLLRETVQSDPTTFLKAFCEDELLIDNINLKLNFEHSKIIVEQMLFAIVFDEELAKKTLYDIILNRWQEKLIQLPIFLIYLLNITKDARYINIFLDELPEDIAEPNDEDEEFTKRIWTALLSDHKINGFEKLNIKTITQLKDKYYYIQKALMGCFKVEMTVETQDEDIVQEN